MGLSTKPENGRSQGWLAAFVCCWTAEVEAESLGEPQGTRPATAGVCLEQPAPLTAMPTIPTPAAIGRRSSRCTRPVSEVTVAQVVPERPPSLSPLDFGDSSFFSKTPQQGPNRDSIHHQPIGTPIDLRRNEVTESRRSSLVPLKLGPVVLRTPSAVDPSRSSAVQTEIASISTDTLAGSSDQASNSRYSSLLRPRQSNSSISSTTPGPLCPSDDTRGSLLTKDLRSPRQPLSTQSSSSSMRSLRLRATDTAGSLNASMPFDRHWLKRKRSSQSVAKSVYEIDREILELNTIVEERRAEAARSVSPSEHVPAIAPSMPVRARSKTLTDIGSAFSKPAMSVSATSARLSRPFMPDLFGPEVVDPIVRPSTAHAASGTKARVSGWISGLLRSSSATNTSIHEPFYKCNLAAHEPPVSTSSLCTLVTDLESPCPTTASSPASKGHARTLLSDTRSMSVSAPPIMKEHAQRNGKQDEGAGWPLVTDDAGQVGVAF